MRRLRVCQLVTELAPAGAERYAYELARRLDRRRFDVRVAALRGGALGDRLADAGVPVTVLGARLPGGPTRLPALIDLLRRGRIDLLHTYLLEADLLGRAGRNLAAVPHLVHTVGAGRGGFQPWRFALARLLAGGCDRLVCASESARRWHARRSGLPAWRYAVIPTGVDAPGCAPDAEARRRLRAEWEVEDDALLVAYVGRLDRRKGVDVLLAALSHLAARGEPHRLVIVGDGPQCDMVRTFIAHGEGGGHCRWVERVPDARAVLSAADVFAMPSRCDEFGVAVGEAMAAGLPVIATDVPGVRELVGHDRTGLLVEPEDVVGVAEAIERLAGDADLRRRLGRAGRRYVTDHRGIDAAVRAHERLYLDVAGATRRTTRLDTPQIGA
ncbi:MAG: glycosyltransferase [Planctomycetota bacterium]